MDIKNDLEKIEQYWQIIRNLHFHIEQVGEISTEEYALIEKYLSVISQKYKELMKESPGMVKKTEPAATLGNQKEDEPIPLSTIHTIGKDSNKTEAENEEKKYEQASDIQTKIENQIARSAELDVNEEKLAEEAVSNPNVNIGQSAEKTNKKSISTFLEQMLDGQDVTSTQSVLFPEEEKNPSLNDKLRNLNRSNEDLNSKIKRNIAEKISLNDKFEFIRELFENNPLEYSTAIQLLDKGEVGGWSRIEQKYGNKNNWQEKEGIVEKFRALVTGK